MSAFRGALRVCWYGASLDRSSVRPAGKQGNVRGGCVGHSTMGAIMSRHTGMQSLRRVLLLCGLSAATTSDIASQAISPMPMTAFERSHLLADSLEAQAVRRSAK